MMNIIEHAFDNADVCAAALAEEVGFCLCEGLTANGRATLAVSGGKTPEKFFHVLSDQDIDWARITVTLVDDRCYAPDHPRSNARLVMQTLLQRRAAEAAFVPLYDAITDSIATENLKPFLDSGIDVAVLGMGLDGHTASFFSGAANYDEITDPASKHLLSFTEQTDNNAEKRVTLTLRALLEVKNSFLLLEGQDKIDCFNGIVNSAKPEQFAMGRLLAAMREPLMVYQSP
jgi:6-phosphogluconolactonase